MAIAIKESQNQMALSSLLEENSDRLLTCVHCGLCLPACPTYQVLGNENDSPRGRIYLMRAVVEGKIGVGDSFITHIDRCLGCRGCESVCPSSVPYGHLLEAARVEVTKARTRRGSIQALAVRFVLNHLFTRPRLLGLAMSISRWIRNSGLARFAFDSHLVGGRLRFALALLIASRSSLSKSIARQSANGPRLRSAEADVRTGANKTIEANNGRAIRVALLRGCVMEGLFKETNRATERVLARNDCQVVEAAGQTCCGALHAHAGELETAKQLAKKNIDAFSKSSCDFLIVNAAGCGAAMKEYASLLEGDPDYRDRARAFSSHVRDISEFLVETGIRQAAGEVPRRVTYDAPCHLIHAQRIAQAPVEVLRSIPGIELVNLSGSESCCGGAGIYNLQHPDLSAEIVSDKLRCIKATGADTVATANPGCIMQIGAAALLEGLEVDVIHPVELLDSAYSAGDTVGKRRRSGSDRRA